MTVHNDTELQTDISAESVTRILDNAGELEVVQATAELGSFVVHCNHENAVATGLRSGRGIAKDTMTSDLSREARKLGPAARLQAARLTIDRQSA